MSHIKKCSKDLSKICLKVYPYPFELKEKLQKPMHQENKVQVQYVSFKQKKSSGSLTHSSKHL